MKCGFLRVFGVFVAFALAGSHASFARADEPFTQNVVPAYADLADLTESSPLVILGEIRAVIPIAPPVAGQTRARFYVEARGLEALRGVMPAGQELRYLADIALDAKAKPVIGKKAKVLLYARAVTGGNGELQLVAADAQLGWDAALEARVRAILADFSSPSVPPRITGISMALYQQGDLAGEGETQIFLNTANGAPAAIIVQHKAAPAGAPGAVRWTVSFSEVVDASGEPPVTQTPAWYRLACSLPAMLPAAANVGETQEAKDHALGDYLMVVRELGACGRLRNNP